MTAAGTLDQDSLSYRYDFAQLARGERSPVDETAPVHASVCAACYAQRYRSDLIGGEGGRCNYSDEGEQEAGDDDRTRCMGAGDSHEAPPSRCLTWRVLCCCYGGWTVYYHRNLDDLAFCDQWPGTDDAQLWLVGECHVTELVAESAGCGHRGCVLVWGEAAAWEGGEAASQKLELQRPLLWREK